MKKLSKMISAGLLSLACMGNQPAAAAIPSYPQLGYQFYNIFYYSNYAAPPVVTADAALSAVLPYGTNAAYAVSFYLQADISYSTYYGAANAAYYYYVFQGDYYAYLNYQYPTYAANLQSYYASVANDNYDYLNSSADYLYDYYEAIGDYYYDLVFP